MVIAPLNRILKTNLDNSVAERTNAPVANNIPGLISLGAIPAANTGPYLIRGYRHPTCPGSIAILTLYRNAEGVHILKQKMPANQLKHGYVVAGKLYASFPQFEFARQRALSAVAQLSSSEKIPAPSAFAYAEQGQCQLAETVARYVM